MKKLLIICAAAALFAGPAMAQPGYGYGPRGDYSRDYNRDYRGDHRDYRSNRGEHRGWRDNRRGYRGSSWSRHVRRCLANYRTYNPRTDRYVVRRGVTARCRL